MKQKAFTLYETLIVIMIIGFLSVVLLSTLRPKDITNEGLKKGGKALYLQVEYAVMQIIANHTKNGRLDEIIDGASVRTIGAATSYSTNINGSDFFNKYVKRYIKALRSSNFPSTYKTLALVDPSGRVPNSSLKISSFNGFQAKNDSYFGIRLYGNCTTSESYLYHPAIPSKTTQANSCGQIFMDVNGPGLPNKLGIDQYIVSITMNGVR